MPLIRGHHSFDEKFTQIPNDWLRDPRLSLKAIGLLAQLMSHTPGWKLSIRSLARANGVGVATIKTAVLELEQFGYLSRSEKQAKDEDGKFADYIWTTQDPFQNPVTVKSAHGKLNTKKNKDKEEHLEKNKQENKPTLKSILLPEDWQPSQELIGMFPDKWPLLDQRKETEAFRLYYLANGKKFQRWDLTYQNWMNRAQGWAEQKQPATPARNIVGDF
jgi:hypothetical protein